MTVSKKLISDKLTILELATGKKEVEEWSIFPPDLSEMIRYKVEDWFDDILIDGNFVLLSLYNHDFYLISNLASRETIREAKSRIQNQAKEYLPHPDEDEQFDRNKFLISGTKFLKMNTRVNSIDISIKMELDPSLILRDETDPVRLGKFFNAQIERFL